MSDLTAEELAEERAKDVSDYDNDDAQSKSGDEFGKSMADAHLGAEARRSKDRQSRMDRVKFKFRNGWRHDDGLLEQYFQSVLANWKMYSGPKKPNQVIKLQCIYRQAMFGDNTAPPPENIKSIQGLKWQGWNALKGTPQIVAKRRFITYLAEINPALIDVMPDEKPPDGFPRNRNDDLICAKCNTKTGCNRPLLDGNKTDLRKQIFDFEYLHEPAALQKWIKNALETQRCVWGVHVMVARIDTKPFKDWFDREENGGYLGYDGNDVYKIVRDLVHYHFEIAWDMQQNKEEYGAEAFNFQVAKVGKLQSVYESLSHEKFVFEAPCTQTSASCNERRKSDGGRNHMHPVTLELPTHKDIATYDEVMELREKCKELGLTITTGIVQNVAERRDIYRQRIADYFAGIQRASKSKERNENRAEVHAAEKLKVKDLSQKMLVKQCHEACHAMQMDQIMILIRRGCNPNTESPRGLTPFLCAMLTGASAEVVEELVRLKADINAVNKFGLTPLIMACRMRDTKSIHMLMRAGASAIQDTGRKGGGRTCVHACAEHGAEEELRIVVDYVKDGGGDALRIVRLLDTQSDDGDTALMLAARIRNGVMCRVLTSLGANPNTRNAQSRNASYIARSAGWTELADWLEKKVGAGVAKLETFSDLQYDKTVRYGAIKAREAIESFGFHFLKSVHQSTTQSPIGPPSIAQIAVATAGKRAVEDQLALLDKHQLYVMHRDPEGRAFSPTANDPTEEWIKTCHELLETMYDNMRKGIAGPNTETAPKPLAWTALHCAAAMNDVRRVKLMIRNGSDPNYRNRDGTTPVMLAAQLQCNEALVEMLIMGADLNAVDNQGFTALAYSTALPLPSNMDRQAVDIILDNDTCGERRISSSQIIKMALKSGVGAGLRQAVENNAEEASREAMVGHYCFMRLLEKAGMQRLDTVPQLHGQLHTSDWRIDRLPEEVAYHGKTRGGDDASETSSELMDRREYERRQREAKEEEEGMGMRCPVCTLPIPCPHFARADVLKKFLEKQTAENGSTGSKLLDAIKAAQERMARRKDKEKDAKQSILDDAGIGDRRTDRSVTFMNKFRKRELELDRALVLRMEEQRLEEEQLLIEEEKARAKALAIANGTWVQWRELFNAHGQRYFVNSDTGQTWEEHIGADGRPYYHDPVSGESKWESPLAKKALAVEDAPTVQAPVEEKKEEVVVKLKVMGEDDTSAKALALDLSDVKAEPGPQTSRKTYTLPSAYRKKSALKNSGAEFLVGLDGTATGMSLETLAEVLKAGGGDAPAPALTPIKPAKARRVLFKGVPGDETRPFEYLKLEELPIVEWAEIPKTSRAGEDLNALIGEGRGEGEVGAGGVDEEKTTAEEKDVTEADAAPAPAPSPPSASSSAPSGKEHLGEDDDLESISSAVSAASFSASSNNSSLSSLAQLDLGEQPGPSSPRDPVKEKLKRLSSNPVPPEVRRLYMFTADPISRFGQSDGLLFSPAAKDAKPLQMEYKGMVSRLRRLGTPVPLHLVRMFKQEQDQEEKVKSEEREREALRAEGKDPVKPKPMPFYPTGAAARKQAFAGDSNGGNLIQVSGWLFVSLEAIETSKAPQERISLKAEVWSDILEQMRGKLLNDWLTRLTLEPLVSPKMWKSDAPRCSVCSVGFVRMSEDGPRTNELFKHVQQAHRFTRAGSTVYDHATGVWSSTATDGSPFEFNDYNLCFPCVVRRELFERVQATFPRAQRAKMAADPSLAWPFRSALAAPVPVPVPAPATATEEYEQGHGLGQGQESPMRHPLLRSLASLGGQQHDASDLSLASSYSNVVSGDMRDIMAGTGAAAASFSQYSSSVSLPSPSPSASLLPLVGAKSPIASKKLSMLDSFETMRRSGSNLALGFQGSLRVGFDDESSLGAADMASVLSETDLAYFDDLGLDEVSVVSSNDSQGSPKNGSGNYSIKGQRGAAARSKERIWDEKPVEVYTSAAERRAQEKVGEKPKTLRDKLQFGKKKDPLFNKQQDESLSLNGPTSLSLLSIPSQFSGSTAAGRVPPKTDQRRPPEILLLPFLISRGHFEEVERTVRIAVSQKSVDEGEGMLMLLKIFHVQADMYKLMGLFPLALAVYLDSVDLAATLLGFGDPGTSASAVCVSSCLRKMHLPALAKTWMANLGHRLEEETFSNNTFAASKLILEGDRRFKKAYMKMEEIWTKFVSPDRPPAWQLRSHKQTIWDTVGLGSLYRCMTAVDGPGVVGRAAFVLHCDRVDPQGLGRFANFVALCFRLRVCDSVEIFRHLVQTLIQKQLAKSLVKSSDVARLYRQVTPPERLHAVLLFLKEGVSVGPEVFDDMLFHCLKVLVPAFMIFYLRHGGAGIKDVYIDNTAQAMHSLAIVVQQVWRCKLARLRVQRKRDNVLEALRLKLEEEQRLQRDIDEAARLAVPISKAKFGKFLKK